MSSKNTTWKEFHTRIMEGDPTAFAELCEIALEPIKLFLLSKHPNQDPSLCETLAADTLLKYHQAPEKYDKSQSDLKTYLCMDARGDLLNEIDKQKRQQKRVVPLTDENVELIADDRNNDHDDMEWLSAYTSDSPEQILREVMELFSEVDQQILKAMAEGIRDTNHYAHLLDIDRLADGEKRREVKRAKDRIKKQVERFGKRRGT